MNFREFLLKEDPMPAGISEPASMPGGGMGGMPPGGPMGGMGGPPMGGGGPPMGGADPMMGGMMGGMGGGMGAPQPQPTTDIRFLNVWDVLEKIVDGKSFKHHHKEQKPSGQPAPQMLQQAPAQQPNVTPNVQQPNPNIQ